MSASDYASLTGDDAVTGEAVALDLPAASLGLRMASGLIDVAITVAVLLFSFVLLGVATINTDEALVAAAVVATSVVTFLVFPTVLETLTRGRSIGKLALGLRTVRDDAGPIVFGHALVRSMIGFVEIYALSGAPAFFSMLLSSRGKRLGDYAAGTYVVRERVRLLLPPPPQMPRHLAVWARTADIAALPARQALAVRQLLGRLPTMTPGSGRQLAARVADDVLRHVAPPPPRGTAPEDFLAAVAAARRERDLERLQRDARLRRRLFSR